MASGAKRSLLATAKLLSGSEGGTQRSSAQKKWTEFKRPGGPVSRVLEGGARRLTKTVKKLVAIRPPERATVKGVSRGTFSRRRTHSEAAACASALPSEKEKSSKLFTRLECEAGNCS